jgi:hypothetical protein
LVDHLAAHHVFEVSEAQRAEIAERADAMAASSSFSADDASDLKFDLYAGDWKTRAEASARLSASGTWTPWHVAGSLASGADASRHENGMDDAGLATAIAIAARETLSPGLAARQAQLKGAAKFALQNEKDGAGFWDKALRPLVSEFAVNARTHGVNRRSAALRALAAATHLKGEAMDSSRGKDAFLLGSAAACLLRAEPADGTDGDGSIMKALARDVAAFNEVRAGMWDESDLEMARLLGAAAIIAVFGRGALSEPKPHNNHSTRTHAHLSR